MSRAPHYYAIKKTRAALRALLSFVTIVLSIVFLRMASEPMVAVLGRDLASSLVESAVQAIDALTLSLVCSALILPLIVYFATKYSARLGISGLSVVLFSLLFALSIMLRGLQFPLCIDDAYIDFRYVHNFLSGSGLSYQNCAVHATSSANPLGISSPLHLFLLAVLNQLFSAFDVAFVSRALNLFLDGGNLLLLFYLVLLLSRKPSAALTAVAIYGLSDYAIGEVVRGKESPLLVSLLLAYMIFATHKKDSARATVAGLFALTRPEGILVLACDLVTGALSALRRGLSFAQIIARYSLPLGLIASCALVLFVYFGGVVPSGMIAKWIIYDRPAYFGFAQLGEYLTKNIFGLSVVANNDNMAYILSLSLYFLLLSLSARLLWSKQALRGYFWALYILGSFFGFLNAVIFVFPWYFAWWCLLPALIWSHWVEIFSPVKKRMFFAFALGLAATVGVWSQTGPGEYLFKLTGTNVTIALPIFRIDTMQGRLPAYIEAAQYVNGAARPGDLVACSELGVLGFTLHDVRILDLHGIISPEMLALYRETGRVRSKSSLITFPRDFARVLKPDWIITYDIFVRESLFKDSYFAQNYRLVKVYPYNFYDSKGLFVYKKID